MPLCLHYYLLGIIVGLILFPTYINLLPNLRKILKLTTYITLIAANTYSYNIPLNKLILINGCTNQLVLLQRETRLFNPFFLELAFK